MFAEKIVSIAASGKAIKTWRDIVLTDDEILAAARFAYDKPLRINSTSIGRT